MRIQVDPDMAMKDHVTQIMRNLVHMCPYGTEEHLLYNTLIWSALEVGSICYSHAYNASLARLQSFQESTLRQLGLAGIAIDSVATRHKDTYTSLLYKQVLLGGALAS